MLERGVALLRLEPKGDVGRRGAAPTEGVKGREERVEVLAIKGVEFLVRRATNEIANPVEITVAELFDDPAVRGDEEVTRGHENGCSALRAVLKRPCLREGAQRPRVEGAGPPSFCLKSLASGCLASLEPL